MVPGELMSRKVDETNSLVQGLWFHCLQTFCCQGGLCPSRTGRRRGAPSAWPACFSGRSSRLPSSALLSFRQQPAGSFLRLGLAES